MISAATEEAEATAEDSVIESRTIITAEATETRAEITTEETETAAAGTEEAETEETSAANRPTTSTTNPSFFFDLSRYSCMDRFGKH